MESLKEDFSRYGARGLALLFCLATGAFFIVLRALFELTKGGFEELLVWSLLALTIAITSARHPIFFLRNDTGVSVQEALIFLGVVFVGPYQAALLAALDTILASRRLQLKPSFFFFNSSNITISVFFAAQVYYLVNGWLLELSFLEGASQKLFQYSVPLLALALSDYLLQLLIVSLHCYLTGLINIRDRLLDTFPWEPLTFLAGATVAGLIQYVYSQHGLMTTAVTMILVMPVPVIVYYTFKTYNDKLSEQEKHYKEITGIYDSILEMLAMAIDAKDDVTHDHIQRVKHFARRMGEMVGLSQAEIEALKAGALLHDIGKIGVPAYILNKPGKLTEHEFEQMKMHTIIGADMLSNVDFRYPVVPIVRHHHERWDGRGYPDGLKGVDIPVTARILTLVDNYDALRSDRPYKKGMTKDQALGYIKENAGVFFDPTLVDIFLSKIDQFEEEASCFKSHEATRQSPRPTLTGNSAVPAAGLAPEVDRATKALLSIAETNQRVTALYEMSRTLAAHLSVEDTVAIVGNRLSKLMPFTTCAIALFDPDRSEYEFSFTAGRHADLLLSQRRPAEAGVTGWVITNQTPMYNANPALDLGFLGTEIAREYRTVMVYPLVKNNESLGSLAVYSSDLESYGAEYINLIQCVSQPAADAIYNATAFERAQIEALTNPATRLLNLRSMTLEFERQLTKAKRLGRELSVVVITLESRSREGLAQASGQRSGEQEGLMSLVRLLRSEIRETDSIGAFSPDMLVMMFPDTESLRIFEIRNRLETAVLNVQPTKTIRFGSATTPKDGMSLEELVQSAQMDSLADSNEIVDIPALRFEDHITA